MPPKGSKRRPAGTWERPMGSPAAPEATPDSKKRGAPLGCSNIATPHEKKPRRATIVKGSTKLGPEPAARIDVKAVRAALNDHVKSLAKMVDDDWHDSYEETDEMLCAWLEDCAGRVASVLDVGVEIGSGFDKCHEVLKIVIDTWENVKAIPFRGDPVEALENADVVLSSTDDWPSLRVHSPEELACLAWPLLLARAAADEKVTDASLLRMIKDAHDHGVEQPHEPSQEESVPEALVDVVRRGRGRLAELDARKSEWSKLPTTKKVHRMRRVIDRRFDGPLHRRTRDPAMFEKGAGGCSMM